MLSELQMTELVVWVERLVVQIPINHSCVQTASSDSLYKILHGRLGDQSQCTAMVLGKSHTVGHDKCVAAVLLLLPQQRQGQGH